MEAQPKPELQPAHRIFLGEMFVFSFFVAGFMSVMVGALQVPVVDAGITVGASMLISAFLFLWLVFTTPTQRNRARYEFMVLSLLPGFLICGGYLGYRNLKEGVNPRSEPLIHIPIVDLEKTGPAAAANNPQQEIAIAAQLFTDEVLVMDDVLASSGFAEAGFVAGQRKRFTRGAGAHGAAISVETYLDFNGFDSSGKAMYTFKAWITNNAGQGFSRRHFTESNTNWVHALAEELEALWKAELEKQRKP